MKAVAVLLGLVFAAVVVAQHIIHPTCLPNEFEFVAYGEFREQEDDKPPGFLSVQEWYNFAEQRVRIRQLVHIGSTDYLYDAIILADKHVQYVITGKSGGGMLQCKKEGFSFHLRQPCLLQNATLRHHAYVAGSELMGFWDEQFQNNGDQEFQQVCMTQNTHVPYASWTAVKDHSSGDWTFVEEKYYNFTVEVDPYTWHIPSICPQDSEVSRDLTKEDIKADYPGVARSLSRFDRDF
eukprot:NODE_3721_length_859_cov_344.549180_g3698_i0.p2 GENE.NODE_3721_length_859_cov_344.549180_g3698_i0~~NODE_3721_length_859_cov_344.549180_g3698_i0.p2  ORF type:complete len:237 (-),score=62.48 NODE_3721_length_859_cov_344.549180_g3698_i0:76-786(-)